MMAQAAISTAFQAKPVLREQAGHALYFAGLVSQQIACLNIINSPKLLLGRVKIY